MVSEGTRLVLFISMVITRGFLVGTILSTIADAAQRVGTCGLILATVAAWLYGLSGARRG